MTKLRPFQKEGVRGIYKFRGRCLLADDQGLGKTLQALEWIRCIPKRRPVVIICPASVKYNWQAEAALHFNMRTEVLEGRKMLPRAAAGLGGALPQSILILNYDILPYWLRFLRRLRPKVVVIDEIHYIQSRRAQRTKAVLKLAKKADSVLGLSGTPFVNRPVELWPVLKAIRPDLFPQFSEFAWRYCEPRWTRYGWKFAGASRKKELRRILYKELMIRRLKSEVLHELPAKVRQVFPLVLKNHKEYRYAEKHFLTWLRKRSPARYHKAKRVEQLAKVGYLLRYVAQLKLPQTIQWIEEFLETHPGEKLVGFTMHRAVIDGLMKHFGRLAVKVDGRVKGKDRHDTVRFFQTNKRVRLFFGNWKAAGVGLNLYAACHGVAFDLPWTPGLLLQGEDRLHRIGQKRKVLFRYLAAKGTIEEKQMKLLMKKSKVLDAILNGERGVEDFDMFSALLKEMQNGS